MAAPARIARGGVRPRHRWQGWNAAGDIVFEGPSGQSVTDRADAVVLALGGASWPRLGSDGAWVPFLEARGVPVSRLRPSNMGVKVAWSDLLRSRFEGQPLKRIALTFEGITVRGEAVVTEDGLEGGAVYALSAPLRETIEQDGEATLRVDLRPDISLQSLINRLAVPRNGQSTSTFLRKAAGLSPVAIALLREGETTLPTDPDALAGLIKAAPLRSDRPQAPRSGDLHRGRRAVLGGRREPDAAQGARRVRGRRNAGLGSADRRLPVAGDPLDRSRSG